MRVRVRHEAAKYQINILPETFKYCRSFCNPILTAKVAIPLSPNTFPKSLDEKLADGYIH